MTHFLTLFKLTLIASEWCAGEAGTDVYNADMQLASFHKMLGGEREGFNSGRNFTHKATKCCFVSPLWWHLDGMAFSSL